MIKGLRLRANTLLVPWWFSGAAAILVIAALCLLPMLAMLKEAGTTTWQPILTDPYTQSVVRFSLWQATLSTVLSLITALPVALSLAHMRRFPGRKLIVSMFGLSLVIPSIVAIYGIVAVFGRTGWVSTALSYLTIAPLDFYGLPGILIAHVFFNMPLAVRVLLINLESIPQEQWRLSMQLGMQPSSLFRFIEWPAIRDQIPGLALLIFTLCFTSFAIVMTLGGGPRATTIEVAIYQALRFDFDIGLSVALAGIQMLTCMTLMLLTAFFKQDSSLGFKSIQNHSKDQTEDACRLADGLWSHPMLKTIQGVVVSISVLLIALPLAALLISSINAKTLAVVTDPGTAIVQYHRNSFVIGHCLYRSGLITVDQLTLSSGSPAF